MKSNKILLSFVLAAAMTGCINDADIPSGNGNSPAPEVKGGNMDIAFVVPNSSNGSRAATAEDSGIYADGTSEEYAVNNVTLYLFDSGSKNLVTTISIAKSELGQGSATGENSKEGQTIVYPCNKEITVEPGTYDILAVANSSQTFKIGQETSLLGQIDAATYEDGLIKNVPSNGFVMSNRGSANQNITVQSPEESKSDVRTKVTINLERTVAKLRVRNAEKETYELKNKEGIVYATIRLNNYKFVNLANKFYTFRHVATLAPADETPTAPTAYTIADGNFGNIADTNGYLIDPYFFDKTVALAPSFTGGSFYTNHLSQQTDSNWSGLTPAGEYATIYCLENCMFRPAQNTVYTTGIMLKGTFHPAASQTIGENGTPVEDPLVYNTLYYFNYKFYTSVAAVGKYGDANISGLDETSTDEALEANEILRFRKSDSGNFSTFYNYWIKHLDNQDPVHMGVMEFGIVRNNIYAVNITNIKNLGPGTPDIKPNPDEYKAYLDVEFGVYPWIVRDQDAELE